MRQEGKGVSKSDKKTPVSQWGTGALVLQGLVAFHSDHVHSVLQCADDSGKVFPGGFFGAGEIENEAAATGAGYGAESMARG